MATILPAPSGLVVFWGRANTGQTITTANTSTPINLQAEDLDDLNGHSLTTNTSRYVAQRAGLYSAMGSILLTSNASSATPTRIAVIMKNGSVVSGSQGWANYVANSYVTVSTFWTPLSLAVGDYVEVGMSSALANTSTFGDGSNGSTLRVDLIR